MIAAVALAGAGGADAALAQDRDAPGASRSSSTRPARVPFGVGERADYTVSLGIFGDVGVGSMEVVAIENVRGHDTYRLRLNVNGKVVVGSVDDTFESWLDVDQLFARRFSKKQHEINYNADKRYDFYPEEMVSRRYKVDKEEPLASATPLDEVSFIYYARTLDLSPGKVYTLERYFSESGNPVVLKVLRREVMRNPNGDEIPVVVVQPIIQTRGLFGEGGKAEIYFTDDWRRIPVKVTSKVPIIGRLGLTLTGYTAGERLPGQRD